jgi:hypothetical protein
MGDSALALNRQCTHRGSESANSGPARVTGGLEAERSFERLVGAASLATLGLDWRYSQQSCLWASSLI